MKRSLTPTPKPALLCRAWGFQWKTLSPDTPGIGVGSKKNLSVWRALNTSKASGYCGWTKAISHHSKNPWKDDSPANTKKPVDPALLYLESPSDPQKMGPHDYDPLILGNDSTTFFKGHGDSSNYNHSYKHEV